MDLYIITSLIHCSSSAFSSQDRLNQTLGTIQSIKSRDPLAIIIVCEGSSYKWNIELPNVHVVYCYVGSFGKSAGECKLISHVLKSYDFSNVLRIFKISGRYVLNDRFDLDFHKKNIDRIVAKIYPSTTHAHYNVMITVLYSFDATLKQYIIECLEKAEVLITQHGLDIEHAMCIALNYSSIAKLQDLGVQGYIGPNGAFWES